MLRENDFYVLEELLRKIIRKFPQQWKKHMKLGFSRTEALVLYHLSNDEKIRSSVLADMLSITTGGLTGITDKMVNGGYIVRERDTKDRRVVFLSITDEGLKLLDQIVYAKELFIKTLFDGLSDDEIDDFKKTANKIVANFEKEVNKGDI